MAPVRAEMDGQGKDSDKAPCSGTLWVTMAMGSERYGRRWRVWGHFLGQKKKKKVKMSERLEGNACWSQGGQNLGCLRARPRHHIVQGRMPCSTAHCLAWSKVTLTPLQPRSVKIGVNVMYERFFIRAPRTFLVVECALKRFLKKFMCHFLYFTVCFCWCKMRSFIDILLSHFYHFHC